MVEKQGWFDYLENEKKKVRLYIVVDKYGMTTTSCIDGKFLEANDYGIVVIIDGFEKPTFYNWTKILTIDEMVNQKGVDK